MNEYIYRAYGLSDIVNNYVNENMHIFINKDNACICNNQFNFCEKYIEIMYDRVIGTVVDIEDKKIVCNTIIVVSKHNKILYLHQNLDVEIFEIKGKRVYPLIDLGDNVSIGSKLCYVTTKKYEVRSFKSNVSGIVVYVGEVFLDKEQTVYIVIAKEDHVYEFNRKC